MSLACCGACSAYVDTDDDPAFYDDELELCASCREREAAQCYECGAWCSGDVTIETEPGEREPVCDACHDAHIAEGFRDAGVLPRLVLA